MRKLAAVRRSAVRITGLAREAAPAWVRAFIVMTILVGVLPAAAAWLGKRLVDAVVAGGPEATRTAVWILCIEAVVMVVILVSRRGGAVVRTMLGLKLGDTIRARIASKAVALELADLESPTVQDQLMRARKQAGSRPIAYLDHAGTLVQSLLATGVAVVLLFDVHPLAMVAVLLASVPGFIAEIRWVRRQYDFEHARTASRRELGYLENVLSREDYAKEARLLRLSAPLRKRFDERALGLFEEGVDVQVHGARAVVLTGAFGTAVFYGAYFAVVYATIAGAITLGEMTMALVLLQQCQNAAANSLISVSRMAQDELYMRELFAFLDRRVPNPTEGLTSGPTPGSGLVFEDVTFTYPGSNEPAIRNVSFSVEPGEVLGIVGENGSGKSTLIKLMTRLYDVEHGRITLDGLDLRQWNRAALWQRTAAMFQDFARFKLTFEENVTLGGSGDAIDSALDAAQARSVMASLEAGRKQRLGRGFPGGVDLSGGQWQKLALARVFFREGADLRVFDEPTAALDAHAEAAVFDKIFEREPTMTIVVAHRLSTLRAADEILVLHEGRIVERGTHEELVDAGDRYASLFETQAAQYDR